MRNFTNKSNQKLMLGLLVLIQLLKNIATFILDRDFSSTLPIIGFISLLLHAAVGLETGLYLSAIFLIIFLSVLKNISEVMKGKQFNGVLIFLEGKQFRSLSRIKIIKLLLMKLRSHKESMNFMLELTKWVSLM